MVEYKLYIFQSVCFYLRLERMTEPFVILHNRKQTKGIKWNYVLLDWAQLDSSISQHNFVPKRYKHNIFLWHLIWMSTIDIIRNANYDFISISKQNLIDHMYKLDVCTSFRVNNLPWWKKMDQNACLQQ